MARPPSGFPFPATYDLDVPEASSLEPLEAAPEGEEVGTELPSPVFLDSVDELVPLQSHLVSRGTGATAKPLARDPALILHCART